MKVKTLSPVLPRSDKDPVGAMRQVLSSYRSINSKIERIYSGVAKRINSIQREEIALNDLGRQSKRYRYLVDDIELQDISLFIQRLINSELLENDTGLFSDLWFMNPYVEAQYQKATEQALQSSKNLASTSAVGADLSRQIRAIQAETILLSVDYQRRIGLVKARTFESMKGLTDEMKTGLSGALGRGMAAGHGINRIKRDIRKILEGDNPDKSGGYKYRAERIARTEINNAYRTAYWDETEELNDSVWKDTGFVTRMLWYSALAPTTRRTHAQRHGQTYNTTEVREFYSVNGNAINCLCTQLQVLVRKSTGKVINSELVDKLRSQRKAYLGEKSA